MSKRLITLRQIQAEKLPRSRSWIFAELKAGRFPEPLEMNGAGPNLWEESVVDAWLQEFVAAAKKRASDNSSAAKRSKEALALVTRRRLRAGGQDAAHDAAR